MNLVCECLHLLILQYHKNAVFSYVDHNWGNRNLLMISEWRLTWCQPCKELASFLKASVIDSAKYQVLHLFLYWIRIFESDLSKDTFKEWVKYVYTIRMIEICMHNSTKSSYSTNKFGPKCFHDSFQYLRKSFSGLFTEWFSSEVAWIQSATLLKDNFVTKAGTAKRKKMN